MSASVPSADAIASIITQVPQSGGPAPRAQRPVKVPSAKKKKKPAVAAAKVDAPSEEAKRVQAAEAGAAAAAGQAAGVGLGSGAGAGVEEKGKAEAGQEGSVDNTLVDNSTTDGSSKRVAPSDPSSSKDASPSTPATTVAADKTSPAATTSAKPVSSAAARSTSKPRKSLLHRILPCLHSTHSDDDHVPSTDVKNGNAIEMSSRTSPFSSNGSPSSSKPTLVTPANGKPSKKGRKSRGGSPDAPPTPVQDTTTPAGAAAATAAANAGGGGVQLPRDETEGVLSGAVVPPGKEGNSPKKASKIGAAAAVGAVTAGGVVTAEEADRASESGSEAGVVGADGQSGSESEGEGSDEDEGDEEDEEDEEEDRIVAMGGMGIPVDENGVPRPLLVELDQKVHKGRKCLVLDLDETLVHSSFKMIHQADFIVPVEIENSVHNVYVIKRPGVDQFMKRMGEIYEVVVFTASLSKYADPVLDMLDIHRVVKHRLFRESCYNHKGNYVKDLSQLGRPIAETIIIDNSPASYIFHPNNAVPVSSWFNDPHDTELTDLIAFLADVAEVEDVRAVLDPRLG